MCAVSMILTQCTAETQNFIAIVIVMFTCASAVVATNSDDVSRDPVTKSGFFGKYSCHRISRFRVQYFIDEIII